MHLGAIHRAFNAGEMIKALIPFGLLRALLFRYARMNFAGKRHGIDHHPFCGAGVDVITDDFHRHRRGVEVLKLQLANTTAIHGVGPLRAKGLNIEIFRPFAHLFIGRERHADIAVGNVFCLQHRQRGHDLRHARFIIRAEQGFAVGGDERMAEQLMQHREHHR